MDETAILKLINEARRDGERSGLAQAIGVVRAYLAVLEVHKSDIPDDQFTARKDQLERVLNTLIERGKEL